MIPETVLHINKISEKRMNSSFPKPANRRSGNTGRQEPGGHGRRHGTVSRQRRPAPVARTAAGARIRDISDNRSPEPDMDKDGFGPSVAVPYPRVGKTNSRLAGHPGGRGEDQEAPVLPGVKPVLELLQSAPERVDAVFLRKGRHGKDMERIVDLCRSAGVCFSLLEPSSFARVYEGPSQGVVARLFVAGFANLDDLLANVMDSPLPLVLALDQVQDPGNAGTLARTLYALGGAGLLSPRHNGVYLGAAASKAAVGALEKLPVSKVANLGQAVDSAKKLGFAIYGAGSGYESGSSGDLAPNMGVPSGKDGGGKRSPEEKSLAQNRQPAGTSLVDLYDLVPRLPAMLILGSEEGGMRASMEKRCDCLIRIPMLRDFDSLNVAQAGGIVISWFARCSELQKKTR